MLWPTPFKQAADGSVCLDYERASRTQWIRLLDVFVVGPLMSYGGARLATTGNPLLGSALFLMGIGTVGLNGRNYLLVREATSASSPPESLSAVRAGRSSRRRRRGS